MITNDLSTVLPPLTLQPGSAKPAPVQGPEPSGDVFTSSDPASVRPPTRSEVRRRGETPLTAPPWTRGPIHLLAAAGKAPASSTDPVALYLEIQRNQAGRGNPQPQKGSIPSSAPVPSGVLLPTISPFVESPVLSAKIRSEIQQNPRVLDNARRELEQSAKLERMQKDIQELHRKLDSISSRRIYDRH